MPQNKVSTNPGFYSVLGPSLVGISSAHSQRKQVLSDPTRAVEDLDRVQAEVCLSSFVEKRGVKLPNSCMLRIQYANSVDQLKIVLHIINQRSNAPNRNHLVTPKEINQEPTIVLIPRHDSDQPHLLRAHRHLGPCCESTCGH